MVYNTIFKEEIGDLIKEGSSKKENDRQWEMIKNKIESKYPDLDARKLVLNYKLYYYSDISLNWREWAKCKDEMIKLYPPQKPYGLTIFNEINGWSGAWLVFMKCNDKKVIKKALQWVEVALQLEGETNRAAYLDTKANLLYKLGRKDKALFFEKEALALHPSKGYAEALENIKNNQPTYVGTGAIWDARTLPKN
jgi:tetratricopeptide (TPR) repeat protein